MSTSTGECPVELPEAIAWDWWCPCCCWLCAFSAGDVSGLKYAPGTVKSGIWKRASWGVTAGETSGVKV
jgi:hypothetical protein